MSSTTPQKYGNKSCLPPKPSTPKYGLRTGFSFENMTPGPFANSPRNSTPIKPASLETSTRAPFKSNNSSPSHKKFYDALSGYSEDSRRAVEYLAKVEIERDRLKADLDASISRIAELEGELLKNQKKLKKRNEKVKFMALLLKETEIQFKSVLESTSKDLEKIIQEQALKIKELNESLKTQQKELCLKWEAEMEDLAQKVNQLRESNAMKIIEQAEGYEKRIAELEGQVEKLQNCNREYEGKLQNYIMGIDNDEENLEIISGLSVRIKGEVGHLRDIIECVVKDKEVRLSMILKNNFKEDKVSSSSEATVRILEKVLLGLSTIRSHVSDLYAERFGDTCKLQ